MFLVSIITPVLNASDTLERALRSVADQKTPEIEHIVIDGGSTDGSERILRAFDSHVDRIVSEPDQGISDAMNKGVRLAQGRLIGVLHADDYYLPGALSVLLDAVVRDDETDVFYGDAFYLDPKTGMRELRRARVELLPRYMSVFHPSIFIRHSVLLQHGLYRLDFRYAMDSELIHRLLTRGSTFRYLEQPVATISLRGVSHRNLLRSLIEYRRSLLMHNLSTVTTSLFWLTRQWCLHYLLKSATVRRAWVALGASLRVPSRDKV